MERRRSYEKSRPFSYTFWGSCMFPCTDLFCARCVTDSRRCLFTHLRTIANSTNCEFCWYKHKSTAYLHVLVNIVIIQIKWTSYSWKENWRLVRESDDCFCYFKDNGVMEIVWSTWNKLEKYFVYFSMTSWKIRLWFRVFKFNSRCFSSDFKIFLPYFSLLMLTYPIQPMQI